MHHFMGGRQDQYIDRLFLPVLDPAGIMKLAGEALVQYQQVKQ